jgi:hypothetical protein
MKTFPKTLLPLLSFVLGLLALVGCGGSGSSTTIAKSETEVASPKATPTPMASLVVPVTMKWGTTSVFAIGLRVTDAAGAVMAGVPVSLYTFTNTSLDDGAASPEPVAVDQIDTAITDATGMATFSARIPGYMTELLTISTKGVATAKKVIPLSENMPLVNVTLGL